MEAQLEQIREQQKETWNKFSSGWRKWDDFTMEWLRPMGTEIINSLKLKPADVVLDVAAGTGEPGLTIATIVTDGKVVITDLAEGMLDVARDNAAKKGVTNCEFVRCDVCELPFDDETFDAVSCRFGFMFFPDMLLAAKEMARVLKPGGKIAAAVWGAPDKNFWITATMSVINQHMQLPASPQGAPSMFRCAAPGFLADLFAQAGFRNTTEKQVNGKLQAGTTANYWRFMNDVAAPVVAALSKADDNTRDKIKEGVLTSISENTLAGNVALDYGTLVVYGQK